MKFINTHDGRVSTDRVASASRCHMEGHNKYSACFVLIDDQGETLGHAGEDELDRLEKSARRVIPNTTGIKGLALASWKDAGKREVEWSEVPVVGWEVLADHGTDRLPFAVPIFAAETASNLWLFTENPDGSVTEWCVWGGDLCTYRTRADAEADKVKAEAA